jgi:hypothetical protein
MSRTRAHLQNGSSLDELPWNAEALVQACAPVQMTLQIADVLPDRRNPVLEVELKMILECHGISCIENFTESAARFVGSPACLTRPARGPAA